jgi:hypothetical protein
MMVPIGRDLGVPVISDDSFTLNTAPSKMVPSMDVFLIVASVRLTPYKFRSFRLALLIIIPLRFTVGPTKILSVTVDVTFLQVGKYDPGVVFTLVVVVVVLATIFQEDGSRDVVPTKFLSNIFVRVALDKFVVSLMDIF